MRHLKTAIAAALFLSLWTAQAAALDLYTVVPRLTESPDAPAVQAQAAEGVCNIINSLAGDGAVSPETLDWSAAYPIHVTDADIFSLPSYSKAAIMEAAAEYTWCYPAVIHDRPIRVTVSQQLAPDHSLVEQGTLSEWVYQDLLAQTGEWRAPMGEIDTDQSVAALEERLAAAGVEEGDDLILLGVCARIRSLAAITFSDGRADQFIPLVYVRLIDAPGDMENALQVGQAYPFAELAQQFQSAGSSQHARLWPALAAIGVCGAAALLLLWRKKHKT